jgi:hypothetical protein
VIIKNSASSEVADGVGIQDALFINLYSRGAALSRAIATESERHQALPPSECRTGSVKHGGLR